MPVEATMFMITNDLYSIREICQDFYLADDERFIGFVPVGRRKTRGIKFSGRSHDVAENKGKSK
jgi:hypothetical protein